MESSPKRRKTSKDGARHDIPFDPQALGKIATASTFVLEAEELLKEVRVDYGKKFAEADKFLFKLREAIGGIEGHEAIPILDTSTIADEKHAQIWEATKKLVKQHGVVVPFPTPKPASDAPYKLAYAKPSQYNVVGSYVSRTMIRAQARHAVDMVVEMPRELFQEKDYQSMRYFYRRAYFVAYIAAGLKKELGKGVEMSFEYLNDNHFLPVLVLRPVEGEEASNGKANEAKSKYVVRIIPCAPAGLFTKTKLLPSCTCNKRGEAKDSSGTPFYNSTVKAEDTFIPYLKVLTLAKNECAAFQDACILGRIWLQQRGLGSAVTDGGFGHFEWSVMIALLLQMGGRNGQAALSSSLSSTELFKAAVQFLASTDFAKKPYLFKSYKPGADAVREEGPVMFDPVREVNIAYKMTAWSANLLQAHAKSTLELLSNPLVDQFEPTFITKADLPLQMFDSISELKVAIGDADESLADDLGFVRARGSEVHRVLKRAFGDRAQLVHIRWSMPSSWTLKTNPAAETSTTITIGVTFDATNMGRQMEFGPPAEEQKEAARFRSFWGQKAELRRFKDGSILECVPWTSSSAFELCQEIMRYILKHQLKIEEKVLTFGGAELAPIISLSPIDKIAFDAAMEAFRVFEKEIRNLEGMPLQVRRLSPVSTGLRYSSVRTPSASLQAGVLHPMEVMLYFESSNRWPENIVAIQETKLEFLLDIDRRLKEANDGISTYLGRDNVELGVDNLGFLDVVYDNGAAFRVRVHSDLEATLLERQVKNTTLDQHVRAQAEQALVRFNWQYELLPLHTQTIATFCTRLPALSPTIRLAKHWFASHKLAGHFSEELIEVLVLYVFLYPHPWRMPSSVTTGFAQVLLFLARWDWRDEPLVLDYSGHDVSASERSDMFKTLEGWRRRDAGMKNHVLFVATPHDKSGSAYTGAGPSRMAAMRMTGLAKAAAKLLREQGFQLEAEALFETSLQVYDIAIHLAKREIKEVLRAAGNESGTKQSRFKNLDDRTGRVPLPMARHPVGVLVDVLNELYEDTLVFYHGGAEDLVIGGVWVPRGEKQRFRVGLPFNFRRVDGEDEDEEGDKVGVNRKAVLLEIARIGGDLIKKIEER